MENVQQGQVMGQESSFAKASDFAKATSDKSEDREMLAEILENSRKTKKYMQWQLYITLVLIVLPILAMAVLLPMVMKSLSTLGGIYGGSLTQ